MRIEIVSGHEGARSYFQIDGADIIIGSSKECHLVLPFPEISRRHLSLLRRGDRYFIIDHGSTNGTFLNEERLPQGAKTEWEPDVSLRLAGQVILTLVEDDMAQEGVSTYLQGGEARADQTRIITLPKNMKSVRKQTAVSRKRLKPKKKGMGLSYLLVLALLGGAWYLHGLLEKRKASLRAKSPTEESPEKSR